MDPSSPAAIGVIGASLAGTHAATALRRGGYTGRIVVAGDEPHPPYDRPPLSKDLLLGAATTAELALPLDAAIGVEWRPGAGAVALDPDARRVTFADGSVERFADGIVIATGARARRLPGAELAGVHVLRTIEDSVGLAAALAARPRRVAILGAGLIGCEVASVCRSLGLEVVVIEPGVGVMERVVGVETGRWIEGLHAARGVEFRFGVAATRFVADDDGHVCALALGDGGELAADCVVLAIGAEPCTEWLADSGLLVGGVLRCDDTATVVPGVVAAGDVVSRHSERHGGHVRNEHWDNAVRQGAHAAATLLRSGTGERYDPVPWFWSDQHGHKLQVLGSARDADETHVLVDDPERRRLVTLYRKGGTLCGVLVANAARYVVRSRPLLAVDVSWDEALQSLRGSG